MARTRRGGATSTRSGANSPTILVVEDIHWASAQLLDLIEHVADTLSDTSVLIVCAARPELLESRPTWGAAKQNATSLTIGPLDGDEAAATRLGAARARRHARAAAPARARERRGQSVLRRGDAPHADRAGRDRAARTTAGSRPTRSRDVPLPDSVHGVIAARLDLLDTDARDAIRRCSRRRARLLAGGGGRPRARRRRSRAARARRRAPDVVDGGSARVLVQARAHPRRRLRVAAAARAARAPPAGRRSGSTRSRPTAVSRPPSSRRTTTRGADVRGDEHRRVARARPSSSRRAGEAALQRASYDPARRQLERAPSSPRTMPRRPSRRCCSGGSRRPSACPDARSSISIARSRSSGTDEVSLRATHSLAVAGAVALGTLGGGARRRDGCGRDARRPAGLAPARAGARATRAARDAARASRTRCGSARRRWRSPSEVGDAFAARQQPDQHRLGPRDDGGQAPDPAAGPRDRGRRHRDRRGRGGVPRAGELPLEHAGYVPVDEVVRAMRKRPRGSRDSRGRPRSACTSSCRSR